MRFFKSRAFAASRSRSRVSSSSSSPSTAVGKAKVKGTFGSRIVRPNNFLPTP